MSSQPTIPVPAATTLTRQDSTSTTTDARFSCNICLDSVVEPVVTQCGHLYCWPCLYKWLEPGMYPEERASLGIMGSSMVFNNARRVCPVCKSSCSVPTLVPIYVRSSSSTPEQQQQSSPMVSAAENLQPEETTQHQQQESVATNEESLQDGDENEAPATTETTTAETTGNPENSEQQNEFLVPPSTGLRQRRTTQQSSSSVPNRPAASSPQHTTSNRHSNPPQHHHNTSNNAWINPMSPNGRPHGSLTHGILMSFQQAAANNHISQQDAQQRAIPSLHNIRDGSFDNSYSYNNQNIDVNSETTQYLSRLLIMLTSFVILCLLLF